MPPGMTGAPLAWSSNSRPACNWRFRHIWHKALIMQHPAIIEISPGGLGLHFPMLDADLYLPALLEGIFGSRKWMAGMMGRSGGLTKSPAKAAASRENGKIGGRPRKPAIA